MAEQAEGGLRSVKFPWSPDGDFAANLAIGNLRESLLASLKDARGVHAETLFVVLGALAGQAAAQAFWERVEKERVEVVDLGGADGRHYFYGDALNAYLIRERDSVLPAWEIVAGAAVAAGATPADLPDWKEIFAHVARTVGGAEFGLVRTPPEHRPGLQPMPALATFWPMARKILSQPAREAVGPGAKAPPEPAPPPPPPSPGGFGRAAKGMFGRKQPQPEATKDIWGDRLALQHWPIVVAVVTSQFIAMTKGVLDPGWAVKIFMEAAVAMSKLHPRDVPQERP